MGDARSARGGRRFPRSRFAFARSNNLPKATRRTKNNRPSASRSVSKPVHCVWADGHHPSTAVQTTRSGSSSVFDCWCGSVDSGRPLSIDRSLDRSTASNPSTHKARAAPRTQRLRRSTNHPRRLKSSHGRRRIDTESIDPPRSRCRSALDGCRASRASHGWGDRNARRDDGKKAPLPFGLRWTRHVVPTTMLGRTNLELSIEMGMPAREGPCRLPLLAIDASACRCPASIYKPISRGQRINRAC